MPIFMDRHNVSEEVNAEMIADLHQKDLKIQHKFNCKVMTYWFDANRKTAFCLVEAPDKAAIKEMHDQAHGEIPNMIIPVDHAVVESFLGRIEDPEKSKKTELNIINDPAFRTIMIVGISPSVMKDRLDKKIKFSIAANNDIIVETLTSFSGRLVKQNPDHFIISFNSVTNAVLCALKIKAAFEKNSEVDSNAPLKLKVGLNAGIPVDEKEGFFEDTIKAAHSYFEFVEGSVVLSSEVKELYECENFNSSLMPDSVVALIPSEEKFLKDLVRFTEKEWNNTCLNTEDFSRSLGFSKSGFYRKIISLTGKSPHNFLKEYRLTRALNLLNKKNMNISEVAFETGFNSPAYFSKCFQEAFGILPSQHLKTDF